MLELFLPANPILAADGYKANHYAEIPNNIEYAYVVAVPRSVSKYSKILVSMGQVMVARWLAEVRITKEIIDEAEVEITEQNYEFNRTGWEIILNEFGGRLPLKLYGLEEGTIIKPQTPILGLVNTDKRFAWLPSYYETVIQDLLWSMTTVATICKTYRITLENYIVDTGSNCSVNYMMHNFGDRSAFGSQAAIMAGIAHAALFDGSDCLRANRYIKKIYNTTKPYLSSIEATEHGSMLANSNSITKNDFGAAKMLVDRLKTMVANGKPNPRISGVIDTYDSRRFVQEFLGEQLHDEIINCGGTLVCRPDSGDPTIEPGMVGNDLISKFGFTYNAHGLKVLPEFLGVIQGDGITVETFEAVIKGWINAGFSLDNFYLGCGSGITNYGRRDDFSFSVKTVANYYDGKWHNLLKDPKTDSRKRSLQGLVQVDEDLNVVAYDEITENSKWVLWSVNGIQTYFQSFDKVRENARQ